jgi:hypothetical protein
MFKVVAIFVTVTLSVGAASCSNRDDVITQEELVRRTQELLDGATTGDRKPWERYFADDSVDHDEKGRIMDKKALVADITPPPADWSGSIKLNHPESRIFGDSAILSYDVAETEVISGQEVHARYHTTDTWVRRNGAWQIVAEQVLRYYEDPAAGTPDIARFADYAGVYELAVGVTRKVWSEGDALFIQRLDKPKEQLLNEAGDLFFRKGVEGRLLFRRDIRGKVDALVDRRNNEDIVWRKTS